jgi:autotransporter-associated beta strand protein
MSAPLAFASALLIIRTAHATDVYFDNNGAKPGSGASSANWNTNSSNWSSDPAGASPTQVWTNGDNAIFSAGTDGTGSFNLTSDYVTVNNLTHKHGRIHILGGTLTLADTSMIVDTQTRVSGDYDLRIDSTLADCREGASTIVKNGPGILHLGVLPHSFSGGLTLNAGTIAIESNGASLGSGILTLKGGNLTKSWGINHSAAATLSNPIKVTGTVNVAIIQGNAGDMVFTGPWSPGESTAVFSVGNTSVNGFDSQSATIQITGNASAYTGTFSHHNLDIGGNRLRFGATSSGNAGFNAAKARFLTEGSTTGDNRLDLADGTFGTFQMGELAGTGGRIRAGWTNLGNTTFEVGSLNTSSRFAGNLGNNPNKSNGLAALNKIGTGALELSSATGNSYSSGTTVNAGRLLVSNTSNSGAGTGVIVVGSKGTLGGTGIVAPSGTNGISVSGALAPGGSVSSTSGGNFRSTTGTLKVNMANTSGAIQMLSGSSLKMELGSAGTSIASTGTSDAIALIAASAGDLAFYDNTVDFSGTGEAGFYKLIDTSSDHSNTYTGLTFDATGVVTSGLTIANLAPGLKGTLIVGTANNGGDTGDLYLQLTRSGPRR